MRNEKPREREKDEKKPLVEVSDGESSHEKSETSDSEAELTESAIKISLEEQEEISINCPIRGTVMKDPVTASDGHIYEREAITEWQAEHGTSPVTREYITSEFKPSYALKEQIEHTLRLAEEKKRAEKEKERADRAKERQKLRHEKEEKKTAKERKQERKQFESEMRKFMEEARAERAVIMEKFARQEERMDKLEEEVEHTRHQNAKLAKEFIEFRDKDTDKSATSKGGLAALATTGTAMFIGYGVFAAVVLTGTTILTGGTIWILIGIIGGAVAIGCVVGGVVGYHDSNRDDQAYARDKPLIDAALRTALNGKVDELGKIESIGNFSLGGLVEALTYAIAVIGGGVQSKIVGWRQENLLPAAQQAQYLEDVKSPKPTIAAIQADPLHIQVKHTLDKGEMPMAKADNTQMQVALNTIVSDGNKKLQEGDVQERKLKASAVYTLATTAVDAGIKAVNDKGEPEFGIVYVAAIKIDQGYVTKQKQEKANTSTTPTQVPG